MYKQFNSWKEFTEFITNQVECYRAVSFEFRRLGDAKTSKLYWFKGAIDGLEIQVYPKVKRYGDVLIATNNRFVDAGWAGPYEDRPFYWKGLKGFEEDSVNAGILIRELIGVVLAIPIDELVLSQFLPANTK